MKASVRITGLEDVALVLQNIAPREAINLLRVTTYDMAKQLATSAKTFTPDNPATGIGDLKSSIGAKRERGGRSRAAASVIVKSITRNFFWRFLEYGQGPDHVEHAMFLKALMVMKPQIRPVFMAAFGRALGKRLARKRKI
mgnify:CR=1 FL=1